MSEQAKPVSTRRQIVLLLSSALCLVLIGLIFVLNLSIRLAARRRA